MRSDKERTLAASASSNGSMPGKHARTILAFCELIESESVYEHIGYESSPGCIDPLLVTTHTFDRAPQCFLQRRCDAYFAWCAHTLLRQSRCILVDCINNVVQVAGAL